MLSAVARHSGMEDRPYVCIAPPRCVLMPDDMRSMRLQSRSAPPNGGGKPQNACTKVPPTGGLPVLHVLGCHQITPYGS